MIKSKKSYLCPLLLIIGLATLLRFHRLAEVPPSLFGDEVDVGYQAYSILKTGRDYSGNPWPIHFQSLADWRTPLFLYATVPFVWLFGLTELGVRFLPALMGVLCIPVVYLLVRELFGKTSLASIPAEENSAGKTLRVEDPKPEGLGNAGIKKSAGFLGLIAALLLAISPWHLQYSRAAFEVTQMLFLILLGVWGFLRGLKNSKPARQSAGASRRLAGGWLVFSGLCLALAPYSYNTAKLFVPLLVGLLVLCFWEKIKRVERGKVVMAILVFILVSLPMVRDILVGEGGDRFTYLSIFTDPTVIPQIGFDRLVDAKVKLEEAPLGIQPTFSSRFFHNKFLAWGTTFLTNYFRAFSTEFLFTFGDINFRHSIQGDFGQLYWLEALFLPIGVFWVFRGIGGKGKKKEELFLLGWLLLAPIPSALTRDGGNHATRLIIMLPPLLILVSLGILGFLNYFGRRKKLVSFLLFTFYFLLFVLYSHRYYVHWPLESEGWWHPGFKQAGQYVLDHKDEYDQVVWSTRGEPPLIFALFWAKIPPERFQRTSLKDVRLDQNLETKHLPDSRFYFGGLNEEFAKNYNYEGALDPKTMYIMPEHEIHTNLKKTPLPKGLKLLKIINLPSGGPAKYIVTGR